MTWLTAAALAACVAVLTAGAPTVRPSSVPPVRQLLRNDCEATALSMLLRGAGVRVGQLVLQRQLPRSGPLDPIERGDALEVWGDPSRGFVGRADGGGPAGGYGVYQQPVRQLALRHGVRLADLTGWPPGAVYAALRAGRPVLVWVGLSDGPYRVWRSPQGRLIRANMGEHAVLLVGFAGRRLLVNDPLTGTRERWTRWTFVHRWRRLGERALALA